MAVIHYGVFFDDGIEKVLQGVDKNNLTHEITISEIPNSNSSYGEYFKPIFKDGYEINTIENLQDVGDGVYEHIDSDHITFTSKPMGGGRYYDL